MRNTICLLLISGLLCWSCSTDNNYTIGLDHIGPLTKTATVNDVEQLFVNDSVVFDTNNGVFSAKETTITLFEKGGTKLITLIPKTENDVSSTIKNIRIFDARYTTDKGIHMGSTFKDIQGVYDIRRIDNLLDSVVLFLDDSDIYITIDKKHMAGEFMFNTRKKIEAINIPDDAPIKYMMIGW